MPINLSKGQKVDLTKGNAGLDSILAGLGWDTNKYDGGHEFDLDAIAQMRREWGVFRARRPEMYGTLMHH